MFLCESIYRVSTSDEVLFRVWGEQDQKSCGRKLILSVVTQYRHEVLNHESHSGLNISYLIFLFLISTIFDYEYLIGSQQIPLQVRRHDTGWTRIGCR